MIHPPQGIIDAHKDSHDPEDGYDPLDAAIAGAINAAASAIGTSHSLARADHNHQHLATLHEPGGGAAMAVDAIAATGSLRTLGLGAQQAMPGDAVPVLPAHKDSHDPFDGADPLDTAAPGAISEAANAVGVSHSLARADHNHQHLATLHEPGGGAVINVGGLSGELADDQPPKAHGADKHTDVTRELFLPAAQAIGDGTPQAEPTAIVPVRAIVDTSEQVVLFAYFKVPDNFVSFSKVELLWNTGGGGGDMFWSLEAAYGADGQLMTQHQESPAKGATTGTGNGRFNVQEPANSLTLISLAIGDYVALRFKRDGTNGGDTLADVFLFGILFTYIAEQ